MMGIDTTKPSKMECSDCGWSGPYAATAGEWDGENVCPMCKSIWVSGVYEQTAKR
jgi:Zn finger protein HypA/HybF involved in hydrogenase expression